MPLEAVFGLIGAMMLLGFAAAAVALVVMITFFTMLMLIVPTLVWLSAFFLSLEWWAGKQLRTNAAIRNSILYQPGYGLRFNGNVVPTGPLWWSAATSTFSAIIVALSVGQIYQSTSQDLIDVAKWLAVAITFVGSVSAPSFGFEKTAGHAILRQAAAELGPVI